LSVAGLGELGEIQTTLQIDSSILDKAEARMEEIDIEIESTSDEE